MLFTLNLVTRFCNVGVWSKVMTRSSIPVQSPCPLDATVLEKGADRLGISLTGGQIDLFRLYYREMLDWNERINLTTVTDWDRVQERHFVESLAVSAAVPDGILSDARFADIGTGAGFPGIPLKIAFPSMCGTLIEATGKKVAILNQMIELLRLDGIQAVHGRAESLGHEEGLRERFDLVTARAVARMPVLAELTLPFCRVGGRVVVHKTARAGPEIDAAAYAIGVLGGELDKIIADPSASTDSRKTLAVIEKLAGTPSRYPRRPGIPAKRPLLRRR